MRLRRHAGSPEPLLFAYAIRLFSGIEAKIDLKAKVLVRLRRRAGSPEPLLFAYAIRLFSVIEAIIYIYIFFLIQFYVPFKIFFSSYETGQSVGGAKPEYPGKTTLHTRKQNLACPTCEFCPEQGANSQR